MNLKLSESFDEITVLGDLLLSYNNLIILPKYLKNVSGKFIKECNIKNVLLINYKINFIKNFGNIMILNTNIFKLMITK